MRSRPSRLLRQVSTESWIFMVGFRVFDVGLLVVWLIWFFHLRDDGGDEPPDEGGGGGGGSRGPERPAGGPGGGGMPLLRPGRVPVGARARDGHRVWRGAERRPAPARGPLPARVRSPGAPARVPRRA